MHSATLLLPLLLAAALGPGTCVVSTDTTTMETDLTTTEMTTETTTTASTTTDTTTTSVTTTPDTTTSNATGVNGTQTSVPFRTTTLLFTARTSLTLSPDSTTSNTTTVQSTNSSASNATANSTVVPISIGATIPHSNPTTNGSDAVPLPSTNTTGVGSTVMPTTSSTTKESSSKVLQPSGTNSSSAVPTAGSDATANSSAEVSPTGKVSVTAQGSTVPGKATTAVLVDSGTPKPSKAAALPPAAVQLLLRISLSFRILNRNFTDSLLDPTSKEYGSLSRSVLTVLDSVFGCPKCASQQAYKGCSELRFSRGSVVAQSSLVFDRGNGSITSSAAEKQLKNNLNPNGFIMDLQLDNIRSAADTTSPAPASTVPDWAIALLVLVSILVLLSFLIFLLLTTCSCRRKSRGKLDLFSTKDSYHPMAEYPTYQSHGRYASPTGKHNPYSQVAGSNGAGAGTFTYTNPSAGSDNL
ncbi:mucin-1 [Struthio camelus]|uniref:mucin-1 n=1 Tax=Struthio camelus TaxID=8801 RepID=UPI0036042DCE